MNEQIFISDFEITENTEALHSILGRALIISTRFDSMCEAAAIAIDIKNRYLFSCISNDEYRSYVLKVSSKYRTLHNNIQFIGFPEDISSILHDARKARNTIVHDASKGLEGCLDTKISEQTLINQISGLIIAIAYGDIAISLTLSFLNGSQAPNSSFISSYKDNVLSWVMGK